MNYKEKYEHGLECIQEILSGAGDSIKTSILRKRLQAFFPELKESEDERIVKCLLNYFNHVRYNGLDLKGTDVDEVIAWLEKQGQKKNTRKREIDDAYLQGICDAKHEIEKQGKKQGISALEAWKDIRLEVYQQASGNRHEPNYSDDSTKMFSLNDIDEIIEKISEQKPNDKVEPKTLDADKVIAWLKNTIREKKIHFGEYGLYLNTNLELPYNSIEDLINDFKEDFGL